MIERSSRLRNRMSRIRSAYWTRPRPITNKFRDITWNSGLTRGSLKKLATRGAMATPTRVRTKPIPAFIQNAVTQ